MNEVKLVYIGRLFVSDTLQKYLKIGNTYLFEYDEESYYPYHFVEYMDYPLTAEEIKECFVSLEEWREMRINKILIDGE